MSDFQKQWAARKKKWEQQENDRVGDIYHECVKRGCTLEFVKAFDTRIWLYPALQTQAFLGMAARDMPLFAQDCGNGKSIFRS